MVAGGLDGQPDRPAEHARLEFDVILQDDRRREAAVDDRLPCRPMAEETPDLARPGSERVRRPMLSRSKHATALLLTQGAAIDRIQHAGGKRACAADAIHLRPARGLIAHADDERLDAHAPVTRCLLA